MSLIFWLNRLIIAFKKSHLEISVKQFENDFYKWKLRQLTVRKMALSAEKPQSDDAISSWKDLSRQWSISSTTSQLTLDRLTETAFFMTISQNGLEIFKRPAKTAKCFNNSRILNKQNAEMLSGELLHDLTFSDN